MLVVDGEDGGVQREAKTGRVVIRAVGLSVADGVRRGADVALSERRMIDAIGVSVIAVCVITNAMSCVGTDAFGVKSDR